MVFYNKKEEVLEIELTSFGKTLHSRGKFKPSYYAFFDDDVIYDAEYGAAGGNADERIRANTPRTRIQYNYTSVEDTKITRDEEDLARFGIVSNRGNLAGTENISANELLQEQRTKEVLIQDQKRRNTFPPIGTSANSTEYHPAWKAYMLQGSLDSSEPDIDTGASVISIPQMDVKKREFTAKAIRGTDDNSSLYGYTFPDGSSVTVKEDDDSEFLIFLKEANASSDAENFLIEVYEVDELTGEEFLTPISFATQFGATDRIVNGLLVDDEGGIEGLDPSEDPTLVGYYFDLEVDSEIDPTIISKAMESGRFADMRDLESFANSARFSSGERERLRLGTSASEIYGLSLSEISQMSEETLTRMQQRAADDLAGLYDNGDETVDDCD